jgi:hypothetical protein
LRCRLREAASSYLKAMMLETRSFFQNQIKKCYDLAATASSESDREFWLRLAHRWEELLQAKQRGGPNFEAIHELRFERPLFAKRRTPFSATYPASSATSRY